MQSVMRPPQCGLLPCAPGPRHCVGHNNSSRCCSRRHPHPCHASRCHYDVLGVDPTASADDIKSAFRKLALQLHPDVNSSPEATARFKRVKDAYEVLGDPSQRQAYNRQRAVQAQASYTRSSRTGGSTIHVVHDMSDIIDITFEEAAAAGFWGWYQKSGSWQSSWQANNKKQKKHQQQQQQKQQQQQQQQQAARQQRQQRWHTQWAAVQQLLSEVDETMLWSVYKVFGRNLERLHSLEDLAELLEGLEAGRQQVLRHRSAKSGGSSSATRPSASTSRAGTQAKAGGSRTAASSKAAASSRSQPNTSGSGSKAAPGRSSRPDTNITRTEAGSSSRSGSSSSKAAPAFNSSARTSSTRSTSSSSTSRPRYSSASSSRGPWASGSRKHSRGLPRFDELSADELYELISSPADPRTALAARAWLQENMAAGRLHPSVASNLVFLLSTDWITEALDQEPDQEPDQQDARAWGCFGELFDAGSEQYRDRAGSAYDYVRYSSDDDDGDIVGGSRSRSSSDGGFDDEEGNAVHAVYGSGPWLGLDELFLAMDSLGFDLDSDSDSDDDSNSDFAGF